ncbi:MAG: hypothetical protein ICV69_00085 [Thermoleophilaceae bacterium]|nr:hypothetical protein [Thermoleophilaceae bacterium]
MIALAVATLAPAAPAHAQLTASRLDEAARALESAPVYVDPNAERALSAREVDRLLAAIRRHDAGPFYLAVLPASAADEAGGDPEAALRKIALSVGEPGTYAAVVGDSFRAGATGGVLPPGEAGMLAGQALQAEGRNGTEAVLEDFVRRLGEARAGGGEGGGGASDGGGGFPVFLLLLLGLPLALFAFARRRQRKREQAALEAEFEQVRQVARDDVVALGDDIRALDLDMEMPNADPEARQHYALAVDRYTQASEALDRARRPEDVQPVTELLEEGRWAMEAVRAEMEGRPAPERRPPCFFDPRHGPSVTDVEWAPPGGQPRAVPVCAADAVRIRDGEEPNVRQVPVNGELVPYWQAGPAFGPWAGGFFGGGLLPGLLVGSVLGGALGGFGLPEDAHAAHFGDLGDFGDGGDFGGGDFGGGDFGGGDFGGGDFGGGGDF